MAGASDLNPLKQKSDPVYGVQTTVQMRLKRCDEIITQLASMAYLTDRVGNDVYYGNELKEEFTRLEQEILSWGVVSSITLHHRHWSEVLKVKTLLHTYKE